MATTDQQLLSSIQRLMIETVDNGATWSSGLWTVAEVIDYANQGQREIIKETGCNQKRNTIAITANNFRFDLPTDWINTTRLTHIDSNSRNRRVPRADSMQADLMVPTWRTTTSAFPQAYNDGDLPTLTIQIMPAASVNATLGIIYSWIGTTLSNSGVTLSIPDELVPALKYYIMGSMFDKLGRAQDIERAQYCKLRYIEGLTAAGLLLNSFAARGA